MAKSKGTSSTVLVALVLVFLTLGGRCHELLRVGFYNNRCGQTDVEKIIYKIVRARWQKSKHTLAFLIRLQFHDCFVRVSKASALLIFTHIGCDASILLEGEDTEKTAPPNFSVGGYDIIDDAKAALERRCPGVVSCADIIVIAARVALYLGGASWYEVETGRRDSRISLANDALVDIPVPSIPIPQALRLFARRGLNIEDFVLLLGSHTIGKAHCVNYQDRLWNYHGTMRSDPIMTRSLLNHLKKKCPRDGNSNSKVLLDQTTRGNQSVIDNGFYKAILEGKGVLEVDQEMAFSPFTRRIVRRFANNNEFFVNNIGQAMVKLGRVGVLMGNNGEIRKSCRRVNH
ncbi:hypothetical protein Cgig2_028663 [Carnegiea gigantea]|uniref:Peroxidase n=1 Tax=Carnegiea gigantea TaxID=171969 RepID=A0A9Q1QG48_9CARY|nr:hypothetical protein Cgig2_028663 [Carnegiea gigantea]